MRKRPFGVAQEELHKRVVDPAVRREKGLRGENGAVNCRTRSGRKSNEGKQRQAALPGVTLRLERLENVDALWTQDRRNFCANDRAVLQWCVCPGTIASDIDNDAKMKLIGYPDKNEITTLAVFLSGFHRN